MTAVFRLPSATFVTWPALHALAWSGVLVISGTVPFSSTPAWLAAGAMVGAGQAAVQWATTTVVVGADVLATRNLVWRRHVPIDDISEVHRVGRRGWRGAQLTLADGSRVLLPVPTASILTPNPRFDTELAELCASVAYRGRAPDRP